MEFKPRQIFIKNGHFIVACFLLIPFLYYLLAIRSYIPGYDEACQTEAAIRLSKGYGNTYSWMVNKDLSTPNFSFQNAWPIGYSFSLGSLLFIGLPLEYALKLLKLSIVLATIFAWLRLSNFYIKDIWLKVIFAGFATGYIIKYAQSIIDMIIVLFLSVFSILLFTKNEHETSNRFSYWQKYTRHPFTIGLLIGIMLLFKYSGMFIAASCAFWIFFVTNGLLKESLINLIKFSIPVILIMAYTLINNQHSTTSAYALTASKFVMNIPFFYNGWAGDIFNAIFQSTYLDKMMDTILPNVNSNFLYLVIFVKAIFFLVFFSTLFLLLKKGGKFRELSFWVIINYLALIVFLKVVSGFFFEDVLHWLPLKEGRYYWPLCLFLPMGMLIILEPKWNVLSSISKAAITLGITISIFVGICFYADYKYDQYHSLNIEIPLLKVELSKLIKEDTNTIVFGDQINWQLYPDKGRYNVFGQPPKFSESQFFSKKTMVIMLCSSNTYLPSGSDVELDANEIFEQVANTHSFNRIKVGNFTTIFWREFPAGFSFK